jgi:hypothetical protein
VFFCEHEAVNGNLLDTDSTDAGLVLSSELKLVEDVVELFDESFDLPCYTDI